MLPGVLIGDGALTGDGALIGYRALTGYKALIRIFTVIVLGRDKGVRACVHACDNVCVFCLCLRACACACY